MPDHRPSPTLRRALLALALAMTALLTWWLIRSGEEKASAPVASTSTSHAPPPAVPQPAPPPSAAAPADTPVPPVVKPAPSASTQLPEGEASSIPPPPQAPPPVAVNAPTPAPEGAPTPPAPVPPQASPPSQASAQPDPAVPVTPSSEVPPAASPSSSPPSAELAQATPPTQVQPQPAPASASAPAPYTGPRGGEGRKWTLTFDDEFSGAALDAAKWSSGFGWGAYDSNAWVASCTAPENLHFDGKTLTLSASADASSTPECAPSGKPSSAAAINTKLQFHQEFGFFEARLKVPSTRGVMAAWWLHRQDGTWPPEIDVMEVVGGESDRLQMTIHHSASDSQHRVVARDAYIPHLAMDFHVYGVDWQPDRITFYLDGAPQGTITAEQGAQTQRGENYLILNTTVCSAARPLWCPPPEKGTLWGQGTALQVDWVRVWKRGDQ